MYICLKSSSSSPRYTDPPENTTVSHDTVSVVEDRIPGRVVCSSKASPEPSFEWRYNNKTIVSGNALIINTPMTRNDSGRYTCVAFNKHGITHADTYIDVQCKFMSLFYFSVCLFVRSLLLR